MRSTPAASALAARRGRRSRGSAEMAAPPPRRQVPGHSSRGPSEDRGESDRRRCSPGQDVILRGAMPGGPDKRLRERTNGYTVTPAQYVVLAYLALGCPDPDRPQRRGRQADRLGPGLPDLAEVLRKRLPATEHPCGDRVLQPGPDRAGGDLRGPGLGGRPAPEPLSARSRVVGRPAAAGRRGPGGVWAASRSKALSTTAG